MRTALFLSCKSAGIASSLAIVLALAAGCAKDAPPEPTPGAPQAPGVTLTARPDRVSAGSATLVSGDVAPKRLFARPVGHDVGAGLVTTSLPTSPRVPMVAMPAPETRTFRETMLFLAAGSSATELSIPIDTTAGARLFLGAKGTPSAEEYDKHVTTVLRDIRVHDPARSRQLNVTPSRKLDGEERVLGAIDLDADAKPGVYSVKVGSTAAKHGVVVEMRSPQSPIALSIAPSENIVLLGSEGHVDVKLANGLDAVNDASVVANLILPDGSRGPEAPVKAVGGGLYRVETVSLLDQNSPVGAYNVQVRATGTIDGMAFDRFGETAFGFVVPTAQIGSVSQPRFSLDAGQVATIDVDVDLESATLDRYELSAVLVSIGEGGVERPVAEAQVTDTLDAGKATRTLRFDAGHVALTKLSGTYAVRKLSLYSLGTNTLHHRLGLGLGLTTPRPLALSEIRPAEVTPAIDEMLTTGEFDLTK